MTPISKARVMVIMAAIVLALLPVILPDGGLHRSASGSMSPPRQIEALQSPGASPPQGSYLSPPVYLPDGQPFPTWEIAPVFTRTYHVAQNDPAASDSNPGSAESPFLTIGHAAQHLRPGERVTVHAGIYRERITPPRGGTGPAELISYEAAEGEQVVIRGSRAITGWEHSPLSGSGKVWSAPLPADLFPEENPFALVNLSDEQIDRTMPGASPTRGGIPNILRRGLMFQDGRRLQQVADPALLESTAGTYWVEESGDVIHLRPYADIDPGIALMEGTVQGTIFSPRRYGLGYIRVRGFIIEHAGNRFPHPQLGAVSTMRGHHWIIELNTVRQCNSIGIDIGHQLGGSGPRLAEGGRHIVRRNTVTDCGIAGITGARLEWTLIEFNRLERCGWQQALKIFETGAIKVHGTNATLIRGNTIIGTVEAPGIWMDHLIRNSRCTRNVVVGVQAPPWGGIFIEASRSPNLVDNNFVWGTTGNGIYQHDCDEVIIVHNFVGASTGSPIRMRTTRNREIEGRPSTAKHNTIRYNIFAENGEPPSISDRDNTMERNVYLVPFGTALPRLAHDGGWDVESVAVHAFAAFDSGTLTLSWRVESVPAGYPRNGDNAGDFWGRPCPGDLVTAGPFAGIPSRLTHLRLDPAAPPPASHSHVSNMFVDPEQVIR